MPTPRRRRRDFEPLNPIVGSPAMAPTATSEIPSLVETLVREPTHDEIARRAYQLYESRGGGHGRDLDDWFHAERELRRLALHGVIDRIVAKEGPYAAA
jgi:hypothetical protein